MKPNSLNSAVILPFPASTSLSAHTAMHREECPAPSLVSKSLTDTFALLLIGFGLGVFWRELAHMNVRLITWLVAI